VSGENATQTPTSPAPAASQPSASRVSFKRAIVFALLPLGIGWLAMEALALAYLLLAPNARAPQPDGNVVPDPYRAYRFAPGMADQNGWGSRNSLAFRGREFSASKPPGTLRIACLGGSTTYSPGATTDTHTYPAHLERLLRGHYAGRPFTIEVINAGHPGYTSLESLILFQSRVLDFSPDVAILQSGLNDAWVATLLPDFASDYGSARHALGPIGPYAWEYSPLLTLLFEARTTLRNPYGPSRLLDLVRLMQVPPKSIPTDPESMNRRARESADAFGRNVRTFLATARGNGVIPVVATESVGQWGVVQSVVPFCNERLREIAARESVALVDFAREMPWDSYAFFDPCHLRDRPEGLERKGRIFADALIRAGVIEQAAARLKQK